MADGFTQRAAPLVHADGIYVGLALADYLRDRALSGSAFKKLLSDPAGLYWESEDNPLWIKPERAADRAKLRGSASHCLILEGASAYADRYVVKPDAVLSSMTDLKGWLSAERQRRKSASIDGKLSKEDAQAVKQTGERADLIARIQAIDPDVAIWEPDDDVETLTASDDAYVRLMELFVRHDEDFGPLVTGGFAEVSIFWTDERGRRFKARPDYLTPQWLTDLKTYGRPPRRGDDLGAHCTRIAGFDGYDLQAVHNHRAVAVAAERFASAGGFAISAIGAGASAQIKRMEELLAAYAEKLPTFIWLFLRMGGAPTGIALPFRDNDSQWHEAGHQIEDACEIFDRIAATFAPGEPWRVSHGIQEIKDKNWPLAAVGGAI